MSDVVLYPHQIEMVNVHKALLTRRGVTSDRSETGVGKTPAILQAAKDLEVPFAVICPKTLISHWRRWCRLLELTPVSIVGWEQAKFGNAPRLYDPKNPGIKWLKEFPKTKVLLIFDEAHRAKSKKTQNSKMVSAAASEGHWIALLSATLIQSPLDLLGLAYPLRLVQRPHDAFRYGKRFGVGLNAWNGYADLSTVSQRRELHGELNKVGVRVRKADICETMCVHRVDLIDSEEAAAVRGIYEQLEIDIAVLHAKRTGAIEEITKRLRARQAAELAKVPIFVGEAIKHLEEGSRVTLFLCFTASVDAAKELLRSQSVPALTITGATPLHKRDGLIHAFNFRERPVLVVNIAAGGEGISLHDQDGKYPRVGLLSIPESSTHLIQALGRNDRVGAKSVGLNRILFVAGTMEEKVYENLSGKIRSIDQINDGDLAILSGIMTK